MPLPRAVARFNRRVTNHILGPLARFAPGFGVLIHTGRKSHRTYRTPVNVFRRGQGYVIALTYGPDADWVRNVLVAGGCGLETRGRIVRLTQPRVFRDEEQHALPPLLRRVGGVLGTLAGVHDFLDLTRETS